MLKTNPSEGQFEFKFTQDNFDALRQIVTDETGIELPDNKKTLMYSRLVRRLRALHMKDFSQYIKFMRDELKSGQTHEMMVMVNAMTTNVTDFFREPHHFEHLYKTMEELYDKFGKLRIWCCAASTGQEPWTLAMLVNSFKEKKGRPDIKIFASDIDKEVIRTAEHGVYELDPDVVKNNPFMNKYMEPVGEVVNIGLKHTINHQQFKICEKIRPLVTFKTINLLREWPTPEREFHVVFCRNVIIYFSKDTQREIFTRMAEKMPSGAQLYIGHSESLIGVSDDYDTCGRTTYKRK